MATGIFHYVPQYMKQIMNPNIDRPSPVGTPIISPRLSSTNERSSSLLGVGMDVTKNRMITYKMWGCV